MWYIGIDVSSKKLDVVLRTKGKSRKAKTYNNDIRGHGAIIKALSGKGVVRVGLEATGVYHLDLALMLQAEANIELMVINPHAAKHFSKAAMARTKTDAIDAELLAQFVERMEFVRWQAPAENILALRACSRRLAALTEHKARAKNQLHALEATSATPDFIIEDARLSIIQLEDQIASPHGRTLTLIAKDALLTETLGLLTTIKGIAETSAIQLMGELLVLPPELTQRQWVAMAGLDPRQSSSGSSVNKKPRISKAGNRYLRSALYMPALNASYRSVHVHAYYRHLIEDNGLKKIQAICAIMRKLLHAIHGMLKTRKPFDPAKFYRLNNEAASTDQVHGAA
jgi:transposase